MVEVPTRYEYSYNLPLDQYEFVGMVKYSEDVFDL